jgi:hypothetical protein
MMLPGGEWPLEGVGERSEPLELLAFKAICAERRSPSVSAKISATDLANSSSSDEVACLPAHCPSRALFGLDLLNGSWSSSLALGESDSASDNPRPSLLPLPYNLLPFFAKVPRVLEACAGVDSCAKAHRVRPTV